MRTFVKLFLILMFFVIVASGINQPPFSGDVLIGLCAVAAALASIVIHVLGITISAPTEPNTDEEIEFDVEELTQ